MRKSAPEIKDNSMRYSFTITLKPRCYVEPAEAQFDLTYAILYQMLTSIGTKITLVAEATQNLNVHYHGTICFKEYKNVNHRKCFIDAFRKTKHFGFVSIKQITDEPGWVEYISKSLKESRMDLGRRPIIKDDFEYFNEELYALFGHEW